MSSALLGAPDFTSAVRDAGVGTWVVRLAVTRALAAALGFFVGGDSQPFRPRRPRGRSA